MQNSNSQSNMARKPRVQFPGAIYHVITRGDGRRELFHDRRHYERFTEGLETEVLRSRWNVISYCWMPNHIHLLVQTPEANLSNGMQHWLSGYANWYAKRNQRTGHLYQGRFKAFHVEDMSYFWPLSRYIHLNPCTGKQPLAKRPQDWIHSSYRNCIYKRDACDWLALDQLMSSWRSEFGGASVSGYRRYVQRGLDAVENPLEQALEGWVLGSEKFLQRLTAKVKTTGRHARISKRGRYLSSTFSIHAAFARPKSSIFLTWCESFWTSRPPGTCSKTHSSQRWCLTLMIISVKVVFFFPIHWTAFRCLVEAGMVS